MTRIPISIRAAMSITWFCYLGSGCSSDNGAANSEKHSPVPVNQRAKLDSECDQGNYDKCHELAGLLFGVKDSPDDHRRARELLKVACDGGVSAACTSLGIIHEEGRGVPADAKLGRDYYTKACELKPGAACTIAASLWSGIDEDGTGFSQSLKYFKKACNAGENLSCHRLGMAYWRGVAGSSGEILLSENATEARIWFAKGCEAQHGDCCYTAGIFYDTGHGGNRDHARAREFFKRACQLGNEGGCFNDAYTTGERFVLGDFAYTVSAVEKRGVLGNYFSRVRASDGAFFLTVKYTIENLGKETATVLSDDFKVVD